MTALYVVDTNVVVSALLVASDESPTVTILRRMLAGDLRILLSTDLLAEYRTVLLRPRLRSRHGLTETEIDTLLTDLAANAKHCEPSRVSGAPDPGDNHLLALLIAEPRAALITGDDLLRRTLGKDYVVVSPRMWLDRNPGK